MSDDLLNILNKFKDPELVKHLVRSIESFSHDKTISLMEVCGTHTVSIARSGIKSLLPKNVKLLSGPGCPVCVTANCDIDKIIAISKLPDVIIATFGDMVRVPGSKSSLDEERGKGADVRVCYSPLDALDLAQSLPTKQIIFVGVGFETTTPIIAATIKRAKDLNIQNFSVLCAHKNMGPALSLIASDKDLKIDGFILPGHVSTITGEDTFKFLAEKFHIPGVITGFEPVDILQGIAMLLQQIGNCEAKIEIAYERCVKEHGNVVAQNMIDDIFETCDSTWRGLGNIKNSGYRIRDNYSEYDASKKFDLNIESPVENSACKCGEVLKGKIYPNQCPLFRKVCTPENPIGPCMVSSEGSCAAYYRYY